MAHKSINEYPLTYVAKEMQNILSGILQDYESELNPKVQEITKQVAEDFAIQLKQVTPRSIVNDEHIADTVTVSPLEESYYGKKSKAYVVHYGKWQIAHLLEFGWAARNGVRVTRQAFVRPLFDSNKDKYTRMYKEGLSK